MQEHCVGETGSIPRLGFRGLCLQDSPLGVRDGKHSGQGEYPLLREANHCLSGLRFGFPRRCQRCSHLGQGAGLPSRPGNGPGAQWKGC